LGHFASVCGGYYEQFADNTRQPIVIDASVFPIDTVRSSTNCLPGSAGFHLANRMIRSPDGTIDYITSPGPRQSRVSRGQQQVDGAVGLSGVMA
jgi:hypothetical protein